jgi:hypothetical protein
MYRILLCVIKSAPDCWPPILSCVEKFKIICWVSSLVASGATQQKIQTSTVQIITEKPQHDRTMNSSEYLQQELIEMSGVFVQWTNTSLLYKCTSQAITPCNHVATDILVTDLLSRKRKTLCLVSTRWLSSNRTGTDAPFKLLALTHELQCLSTLMPTVAVCTTSKL